MAEEALGWVATAATLGGTFFAAQGRRWGWSVRAFGDAAWLIWGIALGYHYVIVSQVVFLAIDAVGIRRKA